MNLRLGTRGSPLALIQTELVRRKLHAQGHTTEVVIIQTSGDKNITTSLADMGGKALFAKEIQQALLNDSIDLGIHSLKDLEIDHPEGISLLGVLEREDPSDVLLCRKNLDLNKPFVLGTCSPRRSAFAKSMWPQITIQPLRGNVGTRLAKVEKGEIDATILAKAGLLRLGFYENLKEAFDLQDLPLETFVPAVCQGVIAIEGHPKFLEIVQSINHEDTYKNAIQERQIIKDFGGNCHSAIGVLARTGEDTIQRIG